MERFGNIHLYNLIPAPCYITLTTACIRVVMSGDALKRTVMKGDKVVEEEKRETFLSDTNLFLNHLFTPPITL